MFSISIADGSSWAIHIFLPGKYTLVEEKLKNVTEDPLEEKALKLVAKITLFISSTIF